MSDQRCLVVDHAQWILGPSEEHGMLCLTACQEVPAWLHPVEATPLGIS